MSDTMQDIVLQIAEMGTIMECPFRLYSEKYFEFYETARHLNNSGKLPELDWESQEVLETDLGEYETDLHGNTLYLDVPYEVTETVTDMLLSKNKLYMQAAKAYVELENKNPGHNNFNLATAATQYTDVSPKMLRGLVNYLVDKNVLLPKYKINTVTVEAEYRGKKVDLNKPKRGGSKKFYVYTKNPKTDNVIKVEFGAKSGGQSLSVKLKDPKARKAFADRHNCDQKKDKTKAGYWSCRLPRYAKQLGLSGGGQWW